MSGPRKSRYWSFEIADMTTQTDTRDRSLNNPPPMSLTDWEIMLAELACGMAELLDQEADGQMRQLYPQVLRLGLSRLAACMIRAGTEPVHSIPDAIELMQRPVREWNASPSPPDVIRDLVLMEGEELSRDAEECIVSNPDVAGELTQRIMLRVIENCRGRGDQDGYVKFRRFVIEHPVATHIELIEALDALSDDSLRSLLNEAYEEIPVSSTYGSTVGTCTRCGWTLTTHVTTKQGLCANKRCRQLEGALIGQYPASHPSSPGLRRVRSGLAHYTTQPGGLELNLFRTLSKLKSIKVELWPGFDAYDIGIEFPDEDIWAVDCKDSGRPGFLATLLSQEEFPVVGLWQRAFYVFPSYRKRLAPRYGSVFSSGWRTDDSRVSWRFDDEFLKLVEDKLQKKGDHA